MISHLIKKIIDLIFYLIKSVFGLFFGTITGAGRFGVWLLRLLIPVLLFFAIRYYGPGMIFSGLQKSGGAKEVGNIVKEIASNPSAKELTKKVSEAGKDILGDLSLPEGAEKVSIKQVTDGDTMIVTRADKSDLKIRVIGMDTPESKHPDAKKNTEAGKKAAAEAAKLLPENQEVYLEYDAQTTDPYGRALVYLYVKQGSGYKMYNEIMLEKGLAKTLTIPPNVKYESRFTEIQKKAQEEKVGFWSDPASAWK